jgi:hypothetical protein
VKTPDLLETAMTIVCAVIIVAALGLMLVGYVLGRRAYAAELAECQLRLDGRTFRGKSAEGSGTIDRHP